VTVKTENGFGWFVNAWNSVWILFVAGGAGLERRPGLGHRQGHRPTHEAQEGKAECIGMCDWLAPEKLSHKGVNGHVAEDVWRFRLGRHETSCEVVSSCIPFRLSSRSCADASLWCLRCLDRALLDTNRVPGATIICTPLLRHHCIGFPILHHGTQDAGEPTSPLRTAAT
jgi:hypothetical protein